MPRKTKTNSRSKRYRVKSRRCRRGGAPPSAEAVRAALSALEQLPGASPELIATIKNGIYMDALNEGSAPALPSSPPPVSRPAPPPVSRATHTVDPRDYEPGSKEDEAYKYDVNSPYN